jgi:Flp pilus assembly protein TadG
MSGVEISAFIVDRSMSLPVDLPASFRRLLRSFGRNRSASAAVQFALIAPLFFGLLFAIIETALMFFANQVLETATQGSARWILTGRAQNASYDAAKFKANVVCPAVQVLFDCSGVSFDVQNYPSFQTITISSQIDGSKNFINNMKYCPGDSGDIVVVRLFYQWPTFVTSLGFSLSNLAGNKILLSATAAFKNEPFTAPASPC